MASIDLFVLSYDRVVDTQEVVLNDSNYEQYGYLKNSSGKVVDGKTYYYYLVNENGDEEYYETHDVEIKQRYSHTLPNPTSFSKTYSDVDRSGSGRNESDGQMYRERVGHYCSLNVTWDIVPNSVQRRNLIKILRNLPPSFYLTYKDSSNSANETTTEEFYRADINEQLYLFLQDRQIWRGLSTSFIQFNVETYDDSQEPELESHEEYTPKEEKRYVVQKDGQTRTIYENSLDVYLAMGWEVVS